MPAPEETRGLLRGAGVALAFLVLFPVLAMFWPFGPKPGPGMPPDFIPMQALLLMLVYGPLYPFLWAWDLPSVARITFTVLEIVALGGIFAWFSRRLRLRAQVLCGLISFAATVLLATVLVIAAEKT